VSSEQHHQEDGFYHHSHNQEPEHGHVAAPFAKEADRSLEERSNPQRPAHIAESSTRCGENTRAATIRENLFMPTLVSSDDGDDG
jgi:hypothetical protein